MIEQSEQNLPEDMVAFKLIQHFTMQGQATYEEFQTRIQALKLVAQKLDLLRKMEVKFLEQEKYISELEVELEALRELSPTSDEVLEDFDSPN